MKKILVLISIILLLSGCKDGKDIYRVELKDPYTICGKDIYISDKVYFENEIDMSDLIDEINEICEHYKLEEIKNEIENIYYDNDLTKEDILWRLRDIYQYLDK